MRRRSSPKKYVATAVLFAVSLWACPSAYGQPWDGNGVEGDPYLIWDACDMQAIGANPSCWGANFKLMVDIDLSAYTGTSFNMIGSVYPGKPFTGVFDGNGHTISNFSYKETLPWPILHPSLDHTGQRFNTLTNINNMFSDDFIQDEPIVISAPNDINWPPPIPFPPSFGGDGLFASVDGVDAVIKNLTLVDPNIKTFGGSIGALVGHLHNGVVSNCGVEGGIVSKTGGIFGFGPSFVGGLVGYISDGNVSHCYISNCDSVALFWGASAGCLTARNEAGTISNCYAIDSVATDGALISGGLVTFNAGVILNSYVIGSENESGLVGSNIGTISICHATGSAQWAGLVGFNEGTISNCYATGTVAGNNFAGGLVSGNKGEISNCYATAAVDGNNLIGGLVGYNDGTISNCYATGPVTGDVNVGALVGYDDGGSYVSCFWDRDVNPDINGVGNTTEPNVVSESTTNMQLKGTFTDVGWDFTTPVWKICDGPDYPKLWWEKCVQAAIEAEIKIAPQTLSLQSKGNWVACHIWLPEGYSAADIEPNSVFLEDEIGPEWVQINGRLAMAKFSRSEVQDILEIGEVELTVRGKLADGTLFEGTDVITVIEKGGRE